MIKQEIAIATAKGLLGSFPFIGGLLSEYAGLPSSIKQQNILIEMQARLQSIESAYEEFLKEVAEKISFIPENKFTMPPINVIFPIVEASKVYVEDKRIRMMFAELLSKSLNEDTLDLAHVSFVEIIKQLSPFDAEFFKEISKSTMYEDFGNSFLPLGMPYVVTELIRYGVASGSSELSSGLCDSSKKAFVYQESPSHNFEEAAEYFGKLSISLDNLLRLKLVEVVVLPPKEFGFKGYIKEVIEGYNKRINEDTFNNYRYEIRHNWYCVKLTDFGLQFCKAALN